MLSVLLLALAASARASFAPAPPVQCAVYTDGTGTNLTIEFVDEAQKQFAGTYRPLHSGVVFGINGAFSSGGALWWDVIPTHATMRYVSYTGYKVSNDLRVTFMGNQNDALDTGTEAFRHQNDIVCVDRRVVDDFPPDESGPLPEG
jgi:hypothetical protein